MWSSRLTSVINLFTATTTTVEFCFARLFWSVLLVLGLDWKLFRVTTLQLWLNRGN